MVSPVAPRRSVVADVFFGLLDPVPFGCFVAALVFDITYARTAVVLWGKAAGWLIVMGLLAAVIPRLINLAKVCTGRARSMPGDRIDFWLNLFAIAAAIINAFVHSRDAYAVVPTGMWLSALTVALLGIGRILVAIERNRPELPR
jgi:uncharacterized membrane protein